MNRDRLPPQTRNQPMDVSLASTMVPVYGSSSSSGLAEKIKDQPEEDITDSRRDLEDDCQEKAIFEKEFHEQTEAGYSSMFPRSKTPFRWKLKNTSLLEGSWGDLDVFGKILGTSGRDTCLIGLLLTNWYSKVQSMSSLPIFYLELRLRVICMFWREWLGGRLKWYLV